MRILILISLIVSSTACGSGSEVAADPSLAKPPSRPTDVDANLPLTEPGMTLVVRGWDFHFVSDDGDEAWKTVGFDFDGRDTQAISPHPAGHCRSPFRVPAAALLDGDEGRDNAFRREGLFLSELEKLGPDQPFNSRIAAGVGSLILDVPSLPAPGSSHPAVAGTLHHAAELDAPPAFDGSDVWPIFSGRSQSFEGFVRDGQWVSGLGPIRITLPGIVPIDLQLERGILTVSLDEMRGTIAGVLDLETLARTFVETGHHYAPWLTCGTDGLPNLDADILLGEAKDENALCDAISMAIEFELAPVQIGSSQDVPTFEDPCSSQ